MPPKPQPPAWILAAYKPEYLQNVLSVLGQRETRRDVARNASRRKSDPSIAKRLQQYLKKAGATSEQIEHYSVDVGARQENMDRNRYLQLEPYNRTRVVVDASGDGGNQGDSSQNCGGLYLNASFVLEKYGQKWWIATQAPLPNTAHTFLSVLLQPVTRPPPHLLGATSTSSPSSPTTRVRTIVQLTQNIESGRRKAHAYFPSAVGKSLIVPAEAGCQAAALKVTLLRQETIEDAHCLRSTVAVVPVTDAPCVDTDTYEDVEFDAVDDGQGKYGEQVGQGITFTHLLYTSWPDHGAPQDKDRDSLVAFIQLADRINRDMSIASYPLHGRTEESSADPDPPIIVGCSAGVGRTGTFIALSSLMRHLGFLPPAAHPTPSFALTPSPLGNLPDEMAEDGVAQEIDSLREQRQRMVERPEQVVFIYQVLKDIFSPS